MKFGDSSDQHSAYPAPWGLPDESSPLFQYIRFSEFKRLLDRIVTTLDKNGHKSLAVLSQFPGEGRTFFVSALALGYSRLLGKRVLIMNTTTQTQDNSLYIETVYRRGEPGAAGRGGASAPLIDLIYPHVDPTGNLSESSDFQIGQYIRAARDNYDLILADTCALSALNRNNMDPVVIARHCEAAVLLTSRQSMDRARMAEVAGQISQWNIRLMGVIHNQWVQDPEDGK